MSHVVLVPCLVPECTGEVSVDIEVRTADKRPSGHAIVLDVRATHYRTTGSNHTHDPIEGDL